MEENLGGIRKRASQVKREGEGNSIKNGGWSGKKAKTNQGTKEYGEVNGAIERVEGNGESVWEIGGNKENTREDK